MRSPRLLPQALLVLTVASLSSSCSDSGEAVEAARDPIVPSEAPSEASVEEPEAAGDVPARFVSAWRGGAVQIRVDGVPLAGAERVEPFDGEPLKVLLPLGRHRFSAARVEPEGGLIAEAALEVRGERVWLVLVGGDDGEGAPAQLRVVRDDQGEQAEGKQGLVQVINGASERAPLDVALEDEGGQVRHFVNLGPGKGAAYRAVGPGPHKVVVRSGLDGAEAPLYVQEKVELGARTRTTLILTGQRGRRGQPLAMWSLIGEGDDG